MRDQFALILDSLRSSWLVVLVYLPRLLVATVLLVVGWLFARAVRWLAVRLLRLIRLDAAAEHTGFDDFLIRGGVRFTVVTLIGQALYWSVLLVFIVAAGNLMGLTMGPELTERVASYVPNVAAALVVLVVGTFAARFIRGLAEAYLNNIGVKETANIGLLVHGALLIFVAILALEQLGIATSLLASAFELAFGGFCLTLALAFGLGGRAWAESILERTRTNR
jgi:hypothetical protein